MPKFTYYSCKSITIKLIFLTRMRIVACSFGTYIIVVVLNSTCVQLWIVTRFLLISVCSLCWQGIVQGTVPYLGTFLTDLTMIDTAIPDRTECGLINFEKRRKEFEVLAQIKLLQSAAQIYHFQEDKHIWAWFDSVRVFDENEW